MTNCEIKSYHKNVKHKEDSWLCFSSSKICLRLTSCTPALPEQWCAIGCICHSLESTSHHIDSSRAIFSNLHSSIWNRKMSHSIHSLKPGFHTVVLLLVSVVSVIWKKFTWQIYTIVNYMKTSDTQPPYTTDTTCCTVWDRIDSISYKRYNTNWCDTTAFFNGNQCKQLIWQIQWK